MAYVDPRIRQTFQFGCRSPGYDKKLYEFLVGSSIKALCYV